jgi:hypothetical protein
MVMGLAATRGLRIEGLFDLQDFIAEPGGIFVALRFDRLIKFAFEFAQSFAQ